MKVLILGYGNRLRGDDGFGWYAAERLAGLMRGPDVEIRALQQLTPELAEDLARADRVIFLDARRDGPPGVLFEEPVDPVPAPGYAHQLGPATLLAAARELYGRAPEATLFSVAAESFDYREGLSASVIAALDDLCRRLTGIC